MLKNTLVLSLLFGLCLPNLLLAQITSATIRGTISNKEKETLIGATILATHQPTGTEYGTVTQTDGSFTLPNLKPGGPYLLMISYVGYKAEKKENVFVELGTATQFDFTLQENSEVLGEVEVVYDADDLFNQKGSATNIDKKTIERLPSLNRSLQDMTRLTPQGGANAFAGTNYRFNNLSIDGASNNDVLGFQEPSSGAGGSIASGTPGALAKTQPISLDAIQEVQVSIAPFDVKQGNFTGANLNAVTRSGTNIVEGSVYGFGRNQLLTGRSVDDDRTRIEDFYDFQTGARIGFPIIKNKLFAFINYETARRSEPVLGVPGTAGSNVPLSVAQAIKDTLINQYGYNPGSFGETNNQQISDKLFVRLDYNLGKHHQLTLRHNMIKASADNLERGSRVMKFSTQGFTHHSTTNSTVAELKSTFNNISNHLILGHNVVEDDRTYEGDVFPHVEIKYNTSNTILLGSYREASIYGLTLRTTQITDNLNFYKNKHTFTLGTSNELYNLEYRFLTAWNGRWEYRSLQDFFENRPNRIRGVYNRGDNSFDFNKNNPSADFRVFLLSAYLQDEYKWNERLTLTGGFRVDMQVQPDEAATSPELQNNPEFAHFKNDFGTVPQINPRFGFNYSLNGANTNQIRGGAGLFTGRIPFAWYAYAHYINGVKYGNVDIKPGGDVFELEPDVANLQDLQPGLTEINLVDNDFQLPRMLRATLAYDVKLPYDVTFTAEGIFSKNIQGIQFQSINLKDSIAYLEGSDDRFYYLGSSSERKINPNFTNVFLLTNTTEGYQYNLTASVRKAFDFNLNVMGAYTYGESKDLFNGVRNSMAANFNWNQAVNSNNPDLAYSNFDLRHRFLTTADYNRKLGKKKNHLFYASAVFNAQSGSPFSYTIAGDLNKDGSSKNDLIYIPKSAEDIVLAPIVDAEGNEILSAAEQWQQLDEFIKNDNYLSENRGGYAERNGGRTPWNYQVDLRLGHRFSFAKEQKQYLELTLDIFNFTNLINKNWGKQYFVPNLTNSSFQLLEFEGIEDDQPIYQFKNANATPWQIDPLNSRWQAQVGLRYGF